MKPLILNTSSSLFFTKIGLLREVVEQFEVITTKEIYDEIFEGIEIGYRDARIVMQFIEDKKIKIITAKNTEKIEHEFKIKKEDASVIALAQEKESFLATEDRQIEKICIAMGIPIINAAAMVFLFWNRKKYTNTQAILLLDLLIKTGYNRQICVQIMEKILAGEKNG